MDCSLTLSPSVNWFLPMTAVGLSSQVSRKYTFSLNHFCNKFLFVRSVPNILGIGNEEG